MASTAYTDILVDKCCICLSSDAQAIHQLNCVRYKQAVRLDFMRQICKDMENSALKNNSERLGEFIRFSSLHFCVINVLIASL